MYKSRSWVWFILEVYKMVKVLGVDCSLNNLGCCVCEVDDKLNMKVLSTKLFENSNTESDRALRSFQDLEKAKRFANYLKYMIGENDIDIVVGEVPCGSQSSRACTSAGVVTGLLGSVASFCDFVGVTPIQAKKASVGSKTATKEEVIEWVKNTFPEVKIPLQTRGGKVHIVKKFEHEADSIAIVNSALQTSEFQELLLKHLGM